MLERTRFRARRRGLQDDPDTSGLETTRSSRVPGEKEGKEDGQAGVHVPSANEAIHRVNWSGRE